MSEKPLPELKATLQAQFPRVSFVCTLYTLPHLDSGPYQYVGFKGRSKDLLGLVPAVALAKARAGGYTRFYDEHGDLWSFGGFVDTGMIDGSWYANVEGLETPEGPRKWPLKGIEAQVGRMLRKAFSRRRERAGM
jgi:hypothetical protein